MLTLTYFLSQWRLLAKLYRSLSSTRHHCANI